MSATSLDFSSMLSLPFTVPSTTKPHEHPHAPCQVARPPHPIELIKKSGFLFCAFTFTKHCFAQQMLHTTLPVSCLDHDSVSRCICKICRDKNRRDDYKKGPIDKVRDQYKDDYEKGQSHCSQRPIHELEHFVRNPGDVAAHWES